MHQHRGQHEQACGAQFFWERRPNFGNQSYHDGNGKFLERNDRVQEEQERIKLICPANVCKLCLTKRPNSPVIPRNAGKRDGICG